jgi:Protein of unknown function (DUF3313)
MRKIFKNVLFVILGLVFILTVGCVQQSQYSGFLKDYPQFSPGKKGVDNVYVEEGVDFTKYNKIMMDQVVFYFKKDAEYQGIHPDELVTISEAFHKAMAEALGNDYPLVGEPGPGVLRLRTAITDVEASNPGMSIISTVVPIGLALSTIKKATTGEHTGVGKASLEVEMLDSSTNERIGAAVDTKEGSKLSGVTKWGSVNEAFEFWAKRLRAWLDEIHGR